MKILLLSVFSLACELAPAASFVTVRCSTLPGVTVNYLGTETSSSCSGGSLSSGLGTVQALGQVQLRLASNPASFSSLDTLGSSLVQYSNLTNTSASTNVSIQYQASILTAGALRPGYLQITHTEIPNFFYNGEATLTTGFTLYPQFDPVNPITLLSCDSRNGCSPGVGYYSNLHSLIPVTLGSTLTLESLGVLSNQAGFVDGQSGGSLQVSFQFRFLEADGTTPVALTATPEPASWALIGAGFAMLCSRARLKKR